jgi:glycosyltransferase involved in cell wall biosynthesis
VTELLFFGAYDPSYSRNLIIRKGWRSIGRSYSECRTGIKRKVHTRYPALLARYLRARKGNQTIFVPEFRHKDIPIARMISSLSGSSLVFDPLVSRYETRVLDRGDVRAGSAQAWHNRNLDRISFRLSDIVIADTWQHASFYIDSFGVPREKLKVLPVGYDEETFKPARPRARGEMTEILFYGSFLPLHGIDTIIDAASELAGEEVRFTLLGEGQTLLAAKNRVDSKGIGNVRFKPAVTTEELAYEIGHYDIVLGIFGSTPKASMVIPNKIYQALAVGRPVITADTPALTEFFSPGEHLLAVPAGDGTALASAILSLHKDEGISRELADRGGTYVRQRFNSVEIAKLLSIILRESGIDEGDTGK